MNITTAVATFQMACPISFQQIIESGEFKRFKISPKVTWLTIYFGTKTNRRVALIFKTGKVIAIVSKKNHVDQHIYRFCKIASSRICGERRLHDYQVHNYVWKIKTHDYDIPIIAIA